MASYASYASIARNNNIITADSVIANQRTPLISRPKLTAHIVGKNNYSSLKAAPRKSAEKAVFSISNVAANYTVNDLKSHCRRLGIQVLFCFDITPTERDARCFKLAVAERNVPIVTDSASWPKGVFVRQWNYNSSVRQGNEASYRQEEPSRVGRSEMDICFNDSVVIDNKVQDGSSVEICSSQFANNRSVSNEFSVEMCVMPQAAEAADVSNANAVVSVVTTEAANVSDANAVGSVVAAEAADVSNANAVGFIAIDNTSEQLKNNNGVQ